MYLLCPAFFGVLAYFQFFEIDERFAVAHPPPRGFGARHGLSPTYTEAAIALCDRTAVPRAVVLLPSLKLSSAQV